MNRRFSEHSLRRCVSLNGFWDFAFLGDVDPDAVDLAQIVFDEVSPVPGCFDATPRHAGRRGLAAYRGTVNLAEQTRHRLILDGVQHWCRVFAGGRRIRDHAGGFTRFAAELDGFPAGELEIIILVDNRFDSRRCPLHLDYFDWYQYGGIARGAELQRLGPLWIDALKVVTEDAGRRLLGVTIDYRAIRQMGRAEFCLEVDGKELLHESVVLDEEAGSITRRLRLEGAQLWSPDSPRLYLLRARLGQDDLAERIGIRQIRLDGPRILINDRPLRLLGFCRHEAHPQFGCALPPAVLAGDVQQLHDLGCNFVRGSHYPQDPLFLDLCDEHGLCVWSESVGWQHTAEHLTDEPFLAAQIAHIEEMVGAAVNRPSVIMWGILNESASNDPQCRPAYEKLLGRLRELDPSRPLTYASNHALDDLCLDLADIVSVNTYPGWYHGDLGSVPQHLDRIVEHLDRVGFGGKPLIVSEIGAGALPGWRDCHQERWSEQYQARLLAEVIRHLFIERQRACGLSIWQFCDCRTSEAVHRMLMRPRGFNNKGVLDEYRRPKLAYETVKRSFESLAGL